MEIEEILHTRLGCQKVQNICSTGSSFSQTFTAETEKGRFFIKRQASPKPMMYEGEAKSLQLLDQTATLRVPSAFYYDAHTLILEYLPLRPLSAKTQKEFGRQLAQLHLTRTPWEFGFNIQTWLGSTKQPNNWSRDWPSFFATYRLGEQLKLVPEEDLEVLRLGTVLLKRIPQFFQGLAVRPSLLHGDLWSGNAGETPDGEPVIFDPASYFGHHEAELSIMHMFGGFTEECFDAYHTLIPKAEGFESRKYLYQLYHYLNHYHIFGTSYRSQCLELLNRLSA